MEKNVQLEVLDWGDSGQPVVLLAGGGDTAHVFDEFAPKLTTSFHVYGITRRGFGESGFSAEGYGADRLGDDVLVVLDALKLTRPVLAGHSIAGGELSSVANRHPERVAGLVYLDAAYPYAFDNGKGPTLKQIQDISGPQPPPPGEADLASFRALQQCYLRVLGFTYPEGELRQIWNSNPDGRVCEAAKAYSAAVTPLTESQEKAFENGVPTARVVRMPGAHHYVYLSNETDVLREMRAFLAGLH